MDRLHHKFHAACKYNDPLQVKKHLKKGAKIDHIDPDTGNSGLLDACARGRTLMINFLLAQGADPHVRNHNGETALILVIKSRNLKALETVLKHTAIFHQRNLYDNNGENAKDWAKKTISNKFFEAIIEAEAADYALHSQNKDLLKKSGNKNLRLKRKKPKPPPSKP